MNSDVTLALRAKTGYAGYASPLYGTGTIMNKFVLILLTFCLSATVGFGGISSADPTLCKEGYSEYYANGNLKSCWLKRDLKKDGIIWLDKSPVQFDLSGKVISGQLADATELNGILFPKHAWVRLSAGRVSSSFFWYGTIPSNPPSFLDIVLAGGTGIHFDSQGKRWLVVLGQSQSIDGVSFSKGNQVYFDLTGKPKLFSGAIEEARIIEDLPLPRGTEISLGGQGIHKITLSENLKFKEFELPKGTSVYLQAPGQIAEFYLSEPATVRGMLCRKSVHFYDTGSLHQVTLATEQVIAGQSFPGDRPIIFDKSGVPALAND